MKVTPRLARILDLAHREARELRHLYVLSEHLLLALLKEGAGAGAEVLKLHGISYDLILAEVKKGKNETALIKVVHSAAIAYTPLALRILDLAWKESRLSKHRRVGSGHLLLALIKENSAAAVLLKALEITGEMVQAAIRFDTLLGPLSMESILGDFPNFLAHAPESLPAAKGQRQWEAEHCLFVLLNGPPQFWQNCFGDIDKLYVLRAQLEARIDDFPVADGLVAPSEAVRQILARAAELAKPGLRWRRFPAPFTEIHFAVAMVEARPDLIPLKVGDLMAKLTTAHRHPLLRMIWGSNLIGNKRLT